MFSSICDTQHIWLSWKSFCQILLNWLNTSGGWNNRVTKNSHDINEIQKTVEFLFNINKLCNKYWGEVFMIDAMRKHFFLWKIQVYVPNYEFKFWFSFNANANSKNFELTLNSLNKIDFLSKISFVWKQLPKCISDLSLTPILCSLRYQSC